MFGQSRTAVRNDFSACSGCSLCLLVCPVWRRTRDPRLTPEGRAKAMQHGATATDLVISIESCTLCGACDPVCPENIDLVGMILGLRAEIPRPAALHALQSRLHEGGADSEGGVKYAVRHNAGAAPRGGTAAAKLLPGVALRGQPRLAANVCQLLGCALTPDDGADIALALEAGLEIPPARLESLLAPLRNTATIVVSDGLLSRHLRAWLPASTVLSLGEALSNKAAVRGKLRKTDLYAIEPRAYHADYQRLVKYYDGLRAETGCMFNLDLQRIAIPARARSLPQLLGMAAPDDTEQTRWVLKGRKPERIVVESLEDVAAFKAVSEVPVVHLAELV
jgi:ferredoxin